MAETHPSNLYRRGSKKYQPVLNKQAIFHLFTLHAAWLERSNFLA